MNKTILVLFCSVFLPCLALHSQNAPVTTAGRVTTAVPGDSHVPVAITVNNFINIGQFNLTLKFDTTRVRYVSANANPLLSGMTITYTPPSGNTQGKIVLSWTGAANTSLADGSTLADLIFTYTTGTGILSWAYTFGSICRYKRYTGGILTTLTDSPKYLFYLNGGISNRGAPVVFAPVLMTPVPGPLPLGITVNGFTGIGGFTLYLEYDPAFIAYQDAYTRNPVFTSGFVVGDIPSTGNKRQIVIQWFGNALNLPDGSSLCTLSFAYLSPNCNASTLDWTDNGPSCEFTDGAGDVLIDMPQSAYYLNGIVSEGLLYTWTGNINSDWNNAGNWNACGIPDSTRKIIIPDVSSNTFPLITGPVFIKTLTISPGATFIIGSNGTVTIGDQ